MLEELLADAGKKGYVICISQRNGLWYVRGFMSLDAFNNHIKKYCFVSSGFSDLTDAVTKVIDGLEEINNQWG